MTGVHTHICVKHTVYHAFVRGYNVIVAEDGVEAFTGDDHVDWSEVYEAKLWCKDRESIRYFKKYILLNCNSQEEGLI